MTMHSIAHDIAHAGWEDPAPDGDPFADLGSLGTPSPPPRTRRALPLNAIAWIGILGAVVAGGLYAYNAFTSQLATHSELILEQREALQDGAAALGSEKASHATTAAKLDDTEEELQAVKSDLAVVRVEKNALAVNVVRERAEKHEARKDADAERVKRKDIESQAADAERRHADEIADKDKRIRKEHRKAVRARGDARAARALAAAAQGAARKANTDLGDHKRAVKVWARDLAKPAPPKFMPHN